MARLPVECRHGHGRPPDAGTRTSGPAPVGAKRMTPSAFQAPPRARGGGATVCGAPAEPRSSPLQLAVGEEADGPAVGRPERSRSRPRSPPAAAPSSSPAIAATGATRRRPRRRTRIWRPSGERAKSVGSVGGGRDDVDARLGRRLAAALRADAAPRERRARAATSTATANAAIHASRPRAADVHGRRGVCGAAVSNAPSSARRTSPMSRSALLADPSAGSARSTVTDAQRASRPAAPSSPAPS